VKEEKNSDLRQMEFFSHVLRLPLWGEQHAISSVLLEKQNTPLS
jgi:hypothetical protein